jgi:RecA-family ATPase
MTYQTAAVGIDADAIRADLEALADAAANPINADAADPKNEIPKIGLTFGELEELELPTREEIIHGLARGENGLINAVTNVGKTTLIRNAALSLVCGKSFPPIVSAGRKRRVVIIDSEDSLVFLRSDLNKMLADFSEADKQNVRENLLLVCDVSFQNEELRINKIEHFDLIVSTICDFKADIVFVDTISRSFVIHNENDNSEVKERVMKPLKRLAKITDAAVLASHHIGKAKLEEGSSRENSHRGRGASAFADQSRIILNLERDATDDVILSCPKLKGEKFPDTIFRYDSEKRWLIKQGVSVTRTNYEILMELFDDDKTLKRAEIDEMLEGVMSKQTITRQLSIAVTHGELARNKGYYSKNAQMLTPYSDEHLSISSKPSVNSNLQANQEILADNGEHFFNTDKFDGIL